MAFIDKLYGTSAQHREFYAWAERNNEELYKTLYKPEDFVHKLPQEERPMCCLSTEMDTWLWFHCPLRFILEGIMEQYNGPPHKTTLGQ